MMKNEFKSTVIYDNHSPENNALSQHLKGEVRAHPGVVAITRRVAETATGTLFL